MSDDRKDPLLRRGALTLSYLVLTPDDGLEAFVRRKVACEGIERAQVEKMRGVLDALGFILASKSQEDWRCLEQAWQLLKDIKRPPPEPALEELSDSAASPAQEAATAYPMAAPGNLGDGSGNLGDGSGDVATVEPSGDSTAELPALRNEVSETAMLMDLDLAAALEKGPTPFREGPVGVAPPAMPPLGLSEDIGATAAVSAIEIEALIGDMPAPSMAQLPMSIADYAQLVSRTEPEGPNAAGAGRQQCHEQMRISDEAHRAAVDATFRTLFQTDDAARRQYEHALAQWRRWLHAARS